METNRMRKGLWLALMVTAAGLLPGTLGTASAHEEARGSITFGYATKHHYHHRHYVYYRHHRGYWEDRGGVQVFIRID